ncbi:uroporphyrinogen-III synthase [Mesorhizobium sp. RSR565B]|uniref:uroporphyrinogen-III synthase n=1 Tax=unclassified Mesorhizobium TaxID=325217 RepID=UPI0003CFE3D0|nr:uroporphyrinogen-III synthase [Mesorhizobium sp. L103C565B0]ESZ47154.1 uroporphyrinogen-III synthase [Mesorhizobium sp. L103C565B0]
MRVLVTRPQPGASRTMRRLQELGFEPLLLPLTETVTLPVGADAASDNAVAVAVTSANAVRHAPKELIRALAALPCHAVGRRTAEAARWAGFLSVSEGAGDAERLAEAIAAGLSGKAVVYLTGRVRFPAFEAPLRKAGVEVRTVETYDTISLDYSDDEIRARLSHQAVDAMLLYSAKAAAALQALTDRAGLRDLFENMQVFALSERVAAAFDNAAGKKIRIAREPQEEALLELLHRGD